ncbi:MAG TPA: Mur ligase family protein, partial [Thermomicrobiales bacterium]|nr:Mur ligase family protein [Thermomicrobiales bacterium]
YSWFHRTLGKQIAKSAWQLLTGNLDGLADRLNEIQRLGAEPPEADDRPEMLLDADRHVPVIAVTGTNGKTTTTRLIASMLMHSGRQVGWTSSSGVLIQRKPVLDGDYTGPSGAARVFAEPGVDVAVLETARGGILLRGLGYESNDVSVVTNISADHLGMQGVLTVEELALVKSIVPAVTTPDGFAVLNADDPLVLGMRDRIAARLFLVSRTPDNPEIANHRNAGGWVLWVDDDQVRFAHDGVTNVLTVLNDIPITFGGRATHMLENALCAAAACLAIGLDHDQVRTGLANFRNEASQNRGRLNVYNVAGVTVILDFAHNLAGLTHLLRLGRALVEGEGRLVAVVGTAGDRSDDAFIDIGRLAGTEADHVVAKDTKKYLRGRQPGETIELLKRGLASSPETTFETAPDEFASFEQALAWVSRGDVIAMMCVEEADRLIPHLDQIGSRVS